MIETYYTLLEVPRSASPAEVREAFIKLMRQVHPDVLANVPEYWKRQAEEKSKDITEAYRVLSDPKMRSSYDQQLDAYQHAQASQPQAATGTHRDNQTAQVNHSQAPPAGVAAPRGLVRSWLAGIPSLSKGRVAALACILVSVGLLWPLADLILGRRASAPATSAAPVIRSQPSVPDATAHSPLAAHPKTNRQLHDAVDIPISQDDVQIGTPGQVMQWDARTKSWRRTKPSSTGSAVDGAQWYVQWDTKTNSWRMADPGNSKTALSGATR
jgi:hypothetical protein